MFDFIDESFKMRSFKRSMTVSLGIPYLNPISGYLRFAYQDTALVGRGNVAIGG